MTDEDGPRRTSENEPGEPRPDRPCEVRSSWCRKRAQLEQLRLAPE